MADKERDHKPQQQDDDVVGKAYDSRLMGRLLTYLRPYKLQATISLAAILLKAGSDVLGPYLTKIAVDRYMTAKPAPHPAALTRWLSPNAMVGVTQIASVYLATLVLSYMLEFVQTYLTEGHVRHSQPDFPAYPAHARQLLRSPSGRPPGHPADQRCGRTE
jgi:ATP-binding cassette subfamily B protein